MDLLQNKKVYVLCPGAVVTGGVELSHQLVDFLNNNKREAFIVYCGDNSPYSIPNDYADYNIRLASDAPDTKDSCIVFPEVFLYMATSYHFAVKIFWWMSVDNFFNSSRKRIRLFDLLSWDKKMFLKEMGRRVLKNKEYIGLSYFSLSELARSSDINAYQSEYARLFLAKHGFPNSVPLSDYINQDYLTKESERKKERVVLYNPKKGFAFTKRIIQQGDGISFVPLINLSRSQMKDLLTHSMVYIDFGNHPGKDRIPREAAMSGCCIITGRAGAANNPIDIMIPDEFKFSDKASSVSAVVRLINSIFDDYRSYYLKQKEYRARITTEKAQFESEICSLFSITD